MERPHAHGLEDLITLKCLYHPKVIYRFNPIPIKIPMASFAIIEKQNPKILYRLSNTPKSQNNLEKRRTKLEVSHFLI